MTLTCLLATVALASIASVPSVTWRVRACPDGTNSVRRLWNGISPRIRQWECGERDATSRRVAVNSEAITPAKAPICLMPSGAITTPKPVFLIGEDEDAAYVTTLLERGYAVVRGDANAMAWIARQPQLDATRVAIVGSGQNAMKALRAAALNEQIAMVVPIFTAASKRANNQELADLLALVTPRLLCAVGVGGAAVQPASELYREYKLPERLLTMPDPNWSAIIDFADRQLKAPSTADSDEIDRRMAAACANGSRQLVLKANPLSNDGSWQLTRAILIPDDFTLIFDGCRVELADRTQDNLVRNAGATEGACKPNHGFRILGRNGAVLSGGKRNHYLPGRSGDPNGWRSVGILLCDASNYEISGFAMEETQCWAISQERCHHGHLHDLRFGSTDLLFNQDGIDFRKGCHDCVVENITGSTGDDVVALTAYHDPKGAPPNYDMQIGGNADLGDADNVYNMMIRNIHARCAGGHGMIRLLTCDGIKMHHVTVSNVVDTTQGKQKQSIGTVRVGDVMFHTIRPCKMGEMHHITISDITAAGPVAILIKGPICDSSITGVTPMSGGKRYAITAPIERVFTSP